MCGLLTPSMSTNTGLAPQCTTMFEAATKVSDGSRTSSPGPMSNACMLRCRAAVAELTATASSAPCMAAKRSSNWRTRSPIVSQPSSITAHNARFSGSPRLGEPSSISALLVFVSIRPTLELCCRLFLRPAQIFDATNVDPQASVNKGVDRCFRGKHLAHQVIEAERCGLWNVLEDAGLHAVDAGADRVLLCGLLSEADNTAGLVLEHAVGDVDHLFGHHHRQWRSVLPVMHQDAIQVEIGVDVGVRHEERPIESLPNGVQRSNGAKRLVFNDVLDAQVPAAAVTAV